MKPTPDRERERPQTFFPRTPDEITFAKMRAAMVDLEARMESLEDRQLLAMGTNALADSLFLSPEPEPGAELNGHDRPAEPAE